MNLTRKILLKILFLLPQAILITIISSNLILQLSSAVEFRPQGAWGIYHYFINAKYFRELGYFDLYSCTLKTNSPNLKKIEKVRDLYSYEIVSYNDLPRCPIENFKNIRWTEFSQDVKTITDRANSPFWAQALTDKGFNPTPFWVAIAGPIASLVPITNSINYLILFNLDLVFIVFTGIVIRFYLGRLIGLITLALSFFYFGTYFVLSNNYLQYLWYPLIAACFIYWRLKKPIHSGIFLGIAAGLQAFPGIFVIPILIVSIKYFFKKKKENLRISTLFLSSFIFTLLACIAIGSIYAGNFKIWSEWYKKISIHKNYINSELFNIGFPNFFSTIIATDKSDAYSYTTDAIHTFNRSESLKKNSIPLITTSLFLLISVSYLVWQSKIENALSFGYFYIYILLTLSPYYYLIFTLLPFIFWKYSLKVRLFSTFGILTLFIIHSPFLKTAGYINFIFIQNLISEGLIFLFFISLYLVLFLDKHINYHISFKKLKKLLV